MDKEPSKINAEFLKNGFRKAAEVLVAHRDELNALNVFPVPDGDTGHNMSACVLEACKTLDGVEFDSIKTVSKAIKDGTLMGARGNSGVILSQIFSGFFEVVIKNDRIDIPIFVKAINRANVVATSAVMKPVKGTILTLIEDLAKYSEKHQDEFMDYKHLLEMLTKRAFRVVEKTREMMPKLKQAGVVDAGAKGLAYIVEGFYKYAMGETDINLEKKASGPEMMPETDILPEEITFQYCTEFMVRLFKGVEEKDISSLKQILDKMGDSMVIVHNEDILKGHIHTDHPGLVFEHALNYGDIMKVKADNMKEQHHEVLLKRNGEEVKEEQPAFENDDIDEEVFGGENFNDAVEEVACETKKYAFVAVSPGEGISKILKEMKVDRIVFGGQTMNPSTADIANAIDAVDAETVFILPNNSNIILAAETAAKMRDSEEKHIEVIPTTSVQQGIACLISYVENTSLEENIDMMEAAKSEVVSISVTRAIRDSEIEEHKIIEGEYLFFADKKLISHVAEMEDCLLEGFDGLDMDDYEIMTIFFGKDIDEETVNDLSEKLREKYEDMEISVYDGGQAHYPFYISLE
ncbi:MAG TPA: DAK2 domain-containing protein [Thermotogota bacterium]|nr:DAK2 domain-containing protein [Thermotogota bacterium]HPJ88508.1 DAK2 domain-containing protein [Thermotogota bacterium]HPR96208.1 DAK2 domain-containing protein [Thermotogota bacterium]